MIVNEEFFEKVSDAGVEFGLILLSMTLFAFKFMLPNTPKLPRFVISLLPIMLGSRGYTNFSVELILKLRAEGRLIDPDLTNLNSRDNDRNMPSITDSRGRYFRILNVGRFAGKQLQQGGEVWVLLTLTSKTTTTPPSLMMMVVGLRTVYN